MRVSDKLEKTLNEHLERKQTDTEYQSSFLCEYRDLLLWYWDEQEKCDELPAGEGLDGPRAAAEARVGREYRAKLEALKKKHHKE